MKIAIHHITQHDYENEVSFGNHSLYLRPLDSHRRRVHEFSVETKPESIQRWVRDVYGNIVLVCDFGLKTSRTLRFDTKMIVEVEDEEVPPETPAAATGFSSDACESMKPLKDMCVLHSLHVRVYQVLVGVGSNK